MLAVVALGLAVQHVPETREAPSKQPQGAAKLAETMLRGYRNLIGTRRFMAYALTATGSHAGFHIFAAGAPAVLISGFGVSPANYGYYASLPPIGFLLGRLHQPQLWLPVSGFLPGTPDPPEKHDVQTAPVAGRIKPIAASRGRPVRRLGLLSSAKQEHQLNHEDDDHHQLKHKRPALVKAVHHEAIEFAGTL